MTETLEKPEYISSSLVPNQQAIKAELHSLIKASCLADPELPSTHRLNVEHHVAIGFAATGSKEEPTGYSMSVSPVRQVERSFQHCNFYAKHARAVLEALQKEKNMGGELNLGAVDAKDSPNGLSAIINNVQPNVLLQTLRDMTARGRQSAVQP